MNLSVFEELVSTFELKTIPCRVFYSCMIVCISKMFFCFYSTIKVHIISSMINSKRIFKSNKSIGPDSQTKKVQLKLQNTPEQTLTQKRHATLETNQENTIEIGEDKKVLLLRSTLSKDGRDSSKTIKSRSCLKKETSRGDEEQEGKSTKSIKFKATVTNVFEYSLPDRPMQLSVKNIERRKEKVEQECCYIY